jgi:predicted metal-dependent enzyme (double-stranded beta helix superfamily)
VIRRPHADRDLSRAELELAAAELLRRPEVWERYVDHPPGGARSYQRLVFDEHVEVWLICWSPGNDTGFHDHERSLGAVAVASGLVREETLVPGREPVVREVAAGGVFSFDAGDLQRVRHAGAAPAVTLHLYSPPLRRALPELRREPELVRAAAAS